jgi:formylglycine-generating enzyme required for sulfatase activity
MFRKSVSSIVVTFWGLSLLLSLCGCFDSSRTEFVNIPAGKFAMGVPDGEGYNYMRPKHTVYLDAYQISKYEVTNLQFAQFIASSGYPAQNWRKCGDNTPPNYPDSYPNYPVINVSWNDAKSFCDWQNYSLPTEAQWEKAARGTDARKYPWGNTWLAGKCNHWGTPALPEMLDIYKERGIMPKGSFPDKDTPYGARDMAGNVSEWVADWWQYDYYSFSPPRNPTGPARGENKIIRGGSWAVRGDYCGCANRAGENPEKRDTDLGFRCVRIVH